MVYVMGDFNGWNKTSHALRSRAVSGIWEGFIPGVEKGAKYKFRVCSRYQGYHVDKGDPFAFHGETPPLTASIVWDLDYLWNDEAWTRERSRQNDLRAPMSIYEVHIGSWMRVPEQESRSLSYREMAPKLAEYVTRLGFTHVEFLPVMEHPFYGSWVMNPSVLCATSRYGTPQDFMSSLIRSTSTGSESSWTGSLLTSPVTSTASVSLTEPTFMSTLTPVRGFSRTGAA